MSGVLIRAVYGAAESAHHLAGLIEGWFQLSLPFFPVTLIAEDLDARPGRLRIDELKALQITTVLEEALATAHDNQLTMSVNSSSRSFCRRD